MRTNSSATGISLLSARAAHSLMLRIPSRFFVCFFPRRLSEFAAQRDLFPDGNLRHCKAAAQDAFGSSRRARVAQGEDVMLRFFSQKKRETA
jgi:hypothetical protein